MNTINFLGRGFKKFANIFWKNSITSMDFGKEANIRNEIPSKSSSEPCNISDFDSSKIIPLSWNEKDKKSELEPSLLSDLTGSRNILGLNFISNLDIIKKVKEDALHSNILKNRVCQVIISANDPREDRNNAIQLKSLAGYFLSVFDGHGGQDVAEYANRELYLKFDEKFEELKNEKNMKEKQKITLAMIRAFEHIEKECYLKAINFYKKGECQYAYIGACALCIIVHDNLMYVANLGDCKARLYRKVETDDKVTYLPYKITVTHNASRPNEQQRLREKFKDDKDIIIDKGLACYVKGRLQPTKSLGDFYMKDKEFNNPPSNAKEKYFRKKIENFNGPYIESVPDIQVHELNKNDEFLILATDGLWDWLSSADVAEIISNYSHDKSEIAEALWREALSRSASNSNLKFEQVLKLPRALKREVHDDITILVVDLKNQVSYSTLSMGGILKDLN